MKIYGNDELIRLRTRIDELQQKFASELESVNAVFTPAFVKEKKRKSNIIYYIVMTLFLLLFISIAVFLGVLEAFYLILLLYAINIFLTGLGIFFLKRVNRDYVLVKSEWDKEYNKILRYQELTNILYTLAEVEVYKVMVLTLYHDKLEELKDNSREYESLYNEKLEEVKNSVVMELSNNYNSEAVVAYYVEWGAKITNQNQNDFDYLEARRRKALLGSKNIEIDSKGE